jgi:hypothetical protein
MEEVSGIKTGEFFLEPRTGSKCGLVRVNNKGNSDYQFIEMTIISQLVQNRLGMHLLAGNHIFVIGDQVVKICLGGNADGEDQQE